MLVVMNKNATNEQVENVVEAIIKMGLVPHPIPGKQRVAIGITGNTRRVEATRIQALDGVMEVIHVTKPYKLTSLEMKPERTIIEVGGIEVGGSTPVIIAGPCSVESYDQLLSTATIVQDLGADILRGGAYKPRSSPYSFQGLGLKGLKILAEAREKTGLPVVSEVLSTDTFHLVERFVDIIQIGARNMQNFELLKRAGRSNKPIFLKRGMSATINELLLAAEYIMAEGNYNVMLCERGIRTFSEHTRFTLDLSSIPELRELTHLPLLVDPSHAAGKRKMVMPLARAGMAVGADGLMIEVHPNPAEALSDGPQSLTPEMFGQLMSEIRRIPLISKEIVMEVF